MKKMLIVVTVALVVVADVVTELIGWQKHLERLMPVPQWGVFVLWSVLVAAITGAVKLLDRSSGS